MLHCYSCIGRSDQQHLGRSGYLRSQFFGQHPTRATSTDMSDCSTPPPGVVQ